ncbi:MAG TPA: histidine phosphatase family protein [Chitinophagales bacterium]|nr:histidine phosphatase family protein [Chitinophagales bacterium]
MKTLYIIRHAKSSWEQEDINDMVRPLNDRGKTASLIVGNWLKYQSIQPDYVITSPATRALHTAINICSRVDFPISKMDIDQKIYFGNVKSISEKLKILDNSSKTIDTIFLIGHEPLLSELIHKLTKDVLDKFPTAALYSINWNVDTWAEAMSQLGSKVDFITPKSLINSKE